MNDFIITICNDLYSKNINDNDVNIIIEFELFDKYGIDLDSNIIETITNCRSSYLQNKFRLNVIDKYKKCVLCDIDDAIEACHIYPFHLSNNFDIDNGICFCRNHHYLYDQKYFYIDPNTLDIVILKPSKSIPKINLKKYITNTKYLYLYKELLQF